VACSGARHDALDPGAEPDPARQPEPLRVGAEVGGDARMPGIGTRIRWHRKIRVFHPGARRIDAQGRVRGAPAVTEHPEAPDLVRLLEAVARYARIRKCLHG